MSEPLYAPRWLRRIEAARWVGMSPSKFDQLVKEGRLPQPKTIDGIVVWDRHLLDTVMELLPDKGSSSDNDAWRVAL
jgi:predicted DNA-binding transcriptional regulator AlpA